MQSFVMALRSISANKMRAVLTMLGIIIGVMALVVLVSLVNGATTSVTDKVAELGIDLIANWGSDAYTYDGSVYTFPCGGLGHYVAINMTAWEKAGLGELGLNLLGHQLGVLHLSNGRNDDLVFLGLANVMFKAHLADA